MRGVPYVTLARMTANLAIDVTVGAIPFLGDAFDRLEGQPPQLQAAHRHIEQPRRHTWRDWLFLAALGAILMAIFLLPLLVLAWMLDWLFHHMGPAY